ncbi:MAG: hypothetical protein ACKVJN_09990 [Woeseiales bacterium]
MNLWLMNVANDIEDTYATTRDSKIHINAFSQYKYEDDLIVIKMFVSLSVDPKERCHDLMIRYGNLVGPRLSDWFAHTGYHSNTQPDDLFELLGDRVEFRCSATSDSDKTVRGIKRLHSDQVYWSGGGEQ